MRWPGMFSFLSVSLIDWEEQLQRCSDTPVSLPNASNLFVHSDRPLGFGCIVDVVFFHLSRSFGWSRSVRRLRIRSIFYY